MFYVASDLHIEFIDDDTGIRYITDKIKEEVHNTPIDQRVLFLCGDVGNPFQKTYETFLDFCSNTFKYTILITGNHEYYNNGSHHAKTMTEVDDKIEELVVSYGNVIFLNKSYIILKEFNIIVFGATLWSKIDQNARKRIRDFTRIVTEESKKTNSNLTLSEYHDLYENHLKSLTDNIREISQIRESSKYSDFNLIVMTHHLPSYDLIHPIYKGDNINQFFASDLNDVISTLNSVDTSRISSWLCGHTHYRLECVISGTHAIVHPYGCPNEFPQNGRSVLRLFEIMS